MEMGAAAEDPDPVPGVVVLGGNLDKINPNLKLF
jgi:hypothetical protein